MAVDISGKKVEGGREMREKEGALGCGQSLS